MTKKYIITNAEIEKDIVNALKQIPHQSERSYKNWTLPAIIIAALLIAFTCICPALVIGILLASTTFGNISRHI